MRMAAADLERGGEIKPARRKWRTADPHKVVIVNKRAWLIQRKRA